MARPVAYPASIEPLVRFVEDTSTEHIVARTHDRLAGGTPVKDMLLAGALAVVRSSDLPPGHHGGPLHPLAGVHAVRHIAARLPGEYAQMPVIQNVAVANKHIHSPAMGPYILAEAEPVSEQDSVEATLESIRFAAGRGVYNACDHYFLYLMQRLFPLPDAAALADAGARAPARVRDPEEPAGRSLLPLPRVHLARAGVLRVGVREVHRSRARALRHPADHARG